MAITETNPESGPVHPNMQHGGGTVYATPYAAPAHGSVGLGERPEKVSGKDFKRWKQKMLFYMTILNLARFLHEDAPDLGENPDRQTVAAVDAWKHSDFLCKNYILDRLDNALYNVYSPMVNAKALWESLERKYKTEDAGSKKFVVDKFLDFKMVDSKTVISQVQEFQLILHDIHAEMMVFGESFQVAALIEKLPPTWKDFKNYLKHKRKEMTLEDLIVRLRIEEDNRQSEKKAGSYHQEAKANVVEQGGVFVNLAEISPAKSLAGEAMHTTIDMQLHMDESESLNKENADFVPCGCILGEPLTDEVERDQLGGDIAVSPSILLRAPKFSLVLGDEGGMTVHEMVETLLTQISTSFNSSYKRRVSALHLDVNLFDKRTKTDEYAW
ncbi:hypothetical protein RJ639_004513 [Escallonia herrerae]|uniref:Gag protein n=1 Tax=Escallonia herrerae TaxID=1293975 RepID=A0AA89AYZ5_9ASTE|nr:hypothetical protein RJ639_004513 [Escallonia herrerae]